VLIKGAAAAKCATLRRLGHCPLISRFPGCNAVCILMHKLVPHREKLWRAKVCSDDANAPPAASLLYVCPTLLIACRLQASSSRLATLPGPDPTRYAGIASMMFH
jgi:hypothetical protein